MSGLPSAFDTNRDPGDETDVVSTLEEAVREVLDGWHTACMCDHCRPEKARDLAIRIERYGAALHSRGGWTLAQAKVPANAAFIGTPCGEGEKK